MDWVSFTGTSPNMLRKVNILITHLGDGALLFPLMFILAAYLAVLKSYRAALGLVLAVGACGVVMVGLKVFFLSFQQPVFDIRSPSGHATMAAVVWGGMAVVLAPHFAHWRRFLPLAAAFSLSFAIAVTRVFLRAHTFAEVFLGLAVGWGFVGLYALAMRGQPKAPLRLWLVFLLLFVPFIFLYDSYYIPVEVFVAEIVDRLKLFF
ncbi:MAG: phosphatase PAP2 family protein [Alphaproteobacteria bacterium]|nr:phosphatase PAP2 family protein [Alphaproteobacteria bacterium]